MAVVSEPGAVPLTSAKARIISAAAGLFAEHGVGGTSLQMIAGALGVTKAAVYHQFKTKEEIVIAAAEAEVARLAAALDAAEAEPSPARAREVLLTGIIDGTFYFAEDAIDFANLPTTIVRDGAILVSKSTDGGRTWSTPTLTGTSVDRPFITTDLSTGQIYEASSGPPGPNSSGDPNATPGTGFDRYLVGSRDGVHWSSPEPFGGAGLGAFFSAAHGVLATAITSANPAVCGGTAPVSCVVFQTTKDAGATWSRHVLPASRDNSGSPLVAADPVRAGHFTVAFLNALGTQFQVFQTRDSGNTWSSKSAIVTDDPAKQHWHPWLTYSPQGVLGLMWQNNPPGTGQPYGVFAAISYDGGAHFSQPLQVGSSPAPQPGEFGNSGDDFSYIAGRREPRGHMRTFPRSCLPTRGLPGARTRAAGTRRLNQGLQIT